MIASLAAFVEAWPLFGDAVLTAAVAAFVLGWLGVFVVERRMVFVAAAVTQVAGAGVALGFFLAIHAGWALDPRYTAAALTALAIVGLGRGARAGRTSGDALVGAVFAAAGAAVVLLGTAIAQEAHDIQSLLFGSAVLVGPHDLARVAGVGAAIMALQVAAYRGFAFASFDPQTARVHGLPVALLDTALLLSFGLMVGLAARALGAMPVFAFSVLPAMAALALVRRLPWALTTAAFLGAGIGAGGYVVAFVCDWPVGGTQAATACVVWLCATAGRAAIARIRPFGV